MTQYLIMYFLFTALLIAAWLASLFFYKEKMSRIHYGQVKTNDLWLIVNAFLPFLPACAFGLLLHEDESLGFLIAFALSWWICYIFFLNSFQRDSPASPNSTGLM